MNTNRDDWTNGLTERTARALKNHRFYNEADYFKCLKEDVIDCFKSKQDVIDYIDKGLMYRKPNTGTGTTISNLGLKGLNEVRLWLGMESEADKAKKIKNATKLKSIEKAICLLEENGYTVTLND